MIQVQNPPENGKDQQRFRGITFFLPMIYFIPPSRIA